MATGVKPQNLAVNDGINWVDQFGITAGITGMDVLVLGAKGNYYCEGRWTGAGALTLSNYNAFPVGSTIEDVQAYKTHYHDAATTWKSSAAAS